MRESQSSTTSNSMVQRFRHKHSLQKAYVPISLFLVWVLVSELKLIKPLFLPTPRSIIRAYVDLWSMLPRAMGISISMILSGFILGSLLGIGLGLLMAYSKKLLNAIGAIFDFMRPVPVFALIPLFILWFGIGRAPQVALIAVGVSVVLGVTTTEAIRNIPSIYIHAGYTLGAKRKDVFRTIVVPYIIPHLVGAIRVAAASSFGLDVAAEFMGSQEGLGYLMIVQQQYLKTEGILAIVVLYSILAYILDQVIAKLENRITIWTERKGNEAVAGL